MMQEDIYIVGGGAVGAPLSAFLTKAGRRVVLLRSGGVGRDRCHETVVVRGEAETLSIAVEEQAFAESGTPDGWVVVAAKAHANSEIARELALRSFTGPIVLLQNGIGVENPFVEAGFRKLLRGVLYVTSERNADRDFTLRAPRPSPLGIVSGDVDLLSRALAVFSVPEMPFIGDADIAGCIWRKTITNAVFNSICTITDRNNRLFVESPAAMTLADKVVKECVCLAANHGVLLEREQLLEDIRMISRNSSQLISTLQDVRAGRLTEMEYMNLGLARLASNSGSPLDLSLTSALGELVMIKAGRPGRSSVL